jgi:hypothetical protein
LSYRTTQFGRNALLFFRGLDMQPGTVLFMPRDPWHDTESGEGSLSVSIIVRTPAAFSVGELADHFPELPLAQHLSIVNAMVRGLYLKLLGFGRIPDQPQG